MRERGRYKKSLKKQHIEDLKCCHFTDKMEYCCEPTLRMCRNSVSVKNTLCAKHQKEKDDFFKGIFPAHEYDPDLIRAIP